MKTATSHLRTALIVALASLLPTAAGCGGKQTAPNTSDSETTVIVTPPDNSETPPAPTAPSAPTPASGAESVKDLQSKPTAGNHTLDAWVVGIKPCPPCPPPASCKPCMGEFITVADDVAAGDAAGVKVAAHPPMLDQFQVGKRYRIEVEVNKGDPSAATLQKVDLVRLISAL
jgi:hypothetical protein